MYNAEKKFIAYWEKRRANPKRHYLEQALFFIPVVVLPALLFRDEDSSWTLWKILLMAGLVLVGSVFMGWITFRSYERIYTDALEKVNKESAL